MIKRTLYFGNPAYLSTKLNQLVITKPDIIDQITIPIEDIAIVLLDHPQITITHALIRKLQDNKSSIISCNEQHMPQGLMLPLEGNTTQSETQRYQIQASEPLKKNLWQQTIKAKVNNQKELLQILNLPSNRLEVLQRNVKSGDSTNIEAQAAVFYWSHLFQEFNRDRYGDPPNHLLNYGYAILRSIIARALLSSGLLPTQGIFHKNKYNAYCLADDIMEPYRPFVDKLVHQMYDPNYVNQIMTKNEKVALLNIATENVRFKNLTRPLMVGVSITTKSLADCFSGKRRKVKYPTIC